MVRGRVKDTKQVEPLTEWGYKPFIQQIEGESHMKSLFIFLVLSLMSVSAFAGTTVSTRKHNSFVAEKGETLPELTASLLVIEKVTFDLAEKCEAKGLKLNPLSVSIEEPKCEKKRKLMGGLFGTMGYRCKAKGSASCRRSVFGL